jgi:hypothetical protein
VTDIDLLTTSEYAERRRCSERTIERERANGTGCPYVRLGSRVLYRRADIERHIDAHVVGRDRHRADGDAAAPPARHRRGRPRQHVGGGDHRQVDDHPDGDRNRHLDARRYTDETSS